MANGESEATADSALSGLKVTGGPTPEQWINSYNEKYRDTPGYKMLGTKYVNENSNTTYYNNPTASGPGTTTAITNYKGYLFTRDKKREDGDTKWEQYLRGDYMSTQLGYPINSSNMYYPHTNSSGVVGGSYVTDRYWLTRKFC